MPVNWCPALGTVLANEEVIDGKSERGGHPGRAHAAAAVDAAHHRLRRAAARRSGSWSTGRSRSRRCSATGSAGAKGRRSISHWQRRGASNGRQPSASSPPGPTRSSARPTWCWRRSIRWSTRSRRRQQRARSKRTRQQAARKSDLERTELAKKKTGVFTGAYAINPVNGEKIPIWIADYVLASYGTGAIMAVPAHDERDFEFAKQFDLPIRTVVQPTGRMAEEDEQHARQSDARPYRRRGHRHQLRRVRRPADGRSSRTKITAWLEEKGLGTQRVNYKLRDWLFSRQRYWGEPFPILHELDDQGKPTGVIEPLSPDELPLRLPELEDYKPTGKPEPPLGKATDWLNVTRDGKRYRRETNTMPQWAGSCWYYLRYIDPKNDKAFCDPAKEKHWMPVDLYVGGAEHAVLHLLYSRFWHKVLFDRGHVPTPEPFQRLVNQGMILGEMEFTGFQKDGQWISAAEVKFDGDVATRREDRRAIRLRQAERGAGREAGRRFRAEGRPRRSASTPVPTRCPRAAATSSTPTTSSRSTAPTACGCTRCSWARWRRPSRGACAASRASIAS